MIALLSDDTSSYTQGFSQGRIPGIGVCVCVFLFVYFYVCSILMVLKVGK